MLCSSQAGEEISHLRKKLKASKIYPLDQLEIEKIKILSKNRLSWKKRETLYWGRVPRKRETQLIREKVTSMLSKILPSQSWKMKKPPSIGKM